jgi:hypothetical protein
MEVRARRPVKTSRKNGVSWVTVPSTVETRQEQSIGGRHSGRGQDVEGLMMSTSEKVVGSGTVLAGVTRDT